MKGNLCTKMKIYHSENYDRFTISVAFVSLEGSIRTIWNFAKGIATVVQPGDLLPKECIMEIPNNLFDEMIKAFAEIANEKGMKLESDLKREGKLEATKYHLEDLRKLLKLTK